MASGNNPFVDNFADCRWWLSQIYAAVLWPYLGELLLLLPRRSYPHGIFS